MERPDIERADLEADIEQTERRTEKAKDETSVRKAKGARSKRPSSSRLAKPRTLSAGIVPIYRTDDGQPLYLLLRCYNYWDFPKGGVNRGEAPLDGALRELEEETTLTKVDFQWGMEFRETAPYAHGKVARYYLGAVDRLDVSLPINPLLGRPEHHEFRWFTYEDARPLLHDRVKAVLDWAHREITR